MKMACYCFSTCDPYSTRNFLHQLPSVIRSEESPWVPYLRAVYGDVSFPFDMTQLNYFYHNNAAWRERHPNVDWPMATCRSSPRMLPAYSMRASSPRHLFANSTAPACESHACAIWEHETVQHKVQVPAVVLIPNDGDSHETVGAVVFETTRAGFQGRGRSTYGNDTWMEVMRMSKVQETRNPLYGVWFFHASGSGIYVNAHRTRVLQDKSRLDLLSLPQRRTDTNLPASMRGSLGHKKDAALAQISCTLGLDSLQIRDGSHGIAEIILPMCDGANRSSIRYRPTCASFSYRQGTSAERECLCEDAHQYLNCRMEQQKET